MKRRLMRVCCLVDLEKKPTHLHTKNVVQHGMRFAKAEAKILTRLMQVQEFQVIFFSISLLH